MQADEILSHWETVVESSSSPSGLRRTVNLARPYEPYGYTVQLAELSLVGFLILSKHEVRVNGRSAKAMMLWRCQTPILRAGNYTDNQG
ncbi:hypothetical protein HO173_009096 [Letharia columbiana]|uniref:Uncharacterized protein n=1 Tax=Letharia columbiana TaxID=112416 RepID=A0A8H6L235_9LECA|nr:uncharacterized protein HO173_009096 [Letharia columbiana]KAF6232657.1 hypothetical protein HO173_009096 [Letharia columbiana]